MSAWRRAEVSIIPQALPPSAAVCTALSCYWKGLLLPPPPCCCAAPWLTVRQLMKCCRCVTHTPGYQLTHSKSTGITGTLAFRPTLHLMNGHMAILGIMDGDQRESVVLAVCFPEVAGFSKAIAALILKGSRRFEDCMNRRPAFPVVRRGRPFRGLMSASILTAPKRGHAFGNPKGQDESAGCFAARDAR